MTRCECSTCLARGLVAERQAPPSFITETEKLARVYVAESDQYRVIAKLTPPMVAPFMTAAADRALEHALIIDCSIGDRSSKASLS